MTKKILRSKFIASLFLFLLALFPRLLDLGRFLTADEFLWVDRSRNFLAGLTNPAYQCTTRVEEWEFAEGLACTLRTGHPGVTTMWTGSFGFVLRWLKDGLPTSLHDYVVAISTNPLDPTFIAPERLGTVLIISLWVVVVYWLARRLFGAQVALLGAILIALNPFHIAYSRVIHHDALSTTFMTLSVLCAFIYWGEKGRSPIKPGVGASAEDSKQTPATDPTPKIANSGRRSAVGGRYFYARRWLLISGALAGLAFISKIASLFLMPFIALTGLWFFVLTIKNNGINKNDLLPTPYSLLHSSFYILLRQTILDGLLWFAVSLATVFVVWPALWVIPLETIQIVFSLGFQYSTGGHAKGNFLLGQVSQDPGPLFYPVTWLYRTSPLVMLGLIGAFLFWLKSLTSRRPTQNLNSATPENTNSSFIRYLPLILLFILGYYLMLTIGEKKQERYLLPVYPWLDFIAAVGLVSTIDFLRSRFTFHASRSTLHTSRFTFLILVVFVVNGTLVALNYPYYFTYFNPLLGGAKAAEKAITIGWGEGLDQAAVYLNQKPDPAQTRVASWYESTFAPFYHGPSISYSKEKGKALAGDYVIFYINQTQRRFPDDIFFDYFESRFVPEKTITLHGIDYAWVYPSLGIDHYIQDQTYTGIASLLAWQWTAGDQPLVSGWPAEFELYWEYLGKRPDERFFFRLVDGLDRPWVEGESQLVAAENPPVEQWREGEIILERGTLTPPPDMPPGLYRLQIGFYTQAPAVKTGELLFVVPENEALIPIDHADRANPYRLPAMATSLDQPLGDNLTLLGASWPADPTPSAASFPLDLYWRVEQPLSAAAELHLGLMDGTGEPRQGWFNLTLAETFNPPETVWQPGDIVHTRWQFDLLPEVGPGEYYFELVWPEDISLTLPFGELVISEE